MKSWLPALLAAALFIPLGAHAVPTVLSHHGRLLDSQDTPVQGRLDLTFSLYSTPSGGTPVWTESWEVGFVDGYYSVLLGSDESDPTAPGNLDPALFQQPLFLGIQIGTGPELSPRQQLTAAPYAVFAAQAGTLSQGAVIEGATISGASIQGSSLHIAGHELIDSQGNWVAAPEALPYLTHDDLLALEGDQQVDGEITARRFISTTPSQAPFEVNSEAMVARLNAEMVGGLKTDDLATRADLSATSSQNLIRNASFEPPFDSGSPPSEWTFSNAAFDVAQGLYGTSALHFSTSGEGGFFQDVHSSPQSPALAGRSFTASIWARRISGSGSLSLCLESGPAPGEKDCKLLPASGSAWARTVVNHEVGDYPSYLIFRLSADSEESEWELDAAMVNEGTLAMGWVPNVGDLLLSAGFDGTLIDEGSIDTFALADGSVTTQKLDDNAVTSTKLDEGAVETDKIADRAVGRQKLAIGAVDDTILDLDSVNTHHIVNSAVNEDKLAQGAVHRHHLQTGVVGEDQIEFGAISGPHIASNSITADKLSGDLNAASFISEGSITYDMLAPGAVQGNRIPSEGIKTGHLAAGSVTSTVLGPQAVESGNIKDQAVSTGHLADGSVTDTKLAENSVGSHQLQSGSVGENQLADGSVSSLKIKGQAVGTSQIANAAVTSTQLANNAVTSLKIVDGAVTTNKIPLRNITTDRIALGAVTDQELADGAVVSGKLGPSAVAAGNIAANAVGSTQLASNSVNADKLASNSVDTAHIRASAVTSTQIASGAVGESQLANNAVTSNKLRDGAVSNHKLAFNAVDTDNIVSGAINNSKLASNSVSADKIQNNAITHLKIKAGEIYGDRIRNGGISTDHLAPGSVSSSKLTANAVTDANIENGAISGSKIRAGTLSGSHLNGAAITHQQLASNSVRTAQIQNLAVTTAKINGGAVTNEKIANLAVNTAKLSDNAVSEAKLANNAVGTSKIQDQAVTAAKIGTRTITATQIANSTITATQLANNTVTSAKLASDRSSLEKVSGGSLRAASNGNVGIGKSPQARLDVNGDVMMGNHFLYNGHVNSYMGGGDAGEPKEVKIGEFTLTTNHRELHVYGTLLGQQSSSLGTVDFSAMLRRNGSGDASSYRFSYITTDSGRLLTPRIYRSNSNTNNFVITLESSARVHHYGWRIWVMDRGRQNLFEPDTSATAFNRTGFTQLTPTPDVRAHHGPVTTTQYMGALAFVNLSDARLKLVEGPYAPGLDAILGIEPRSFRYRPENPLGLDSSSQYHGVIAQELQEILPEAVSEDSNGYLQVDPNTVVWTLVNAVKEQQDLIDSQRTQLESQSRRLERLESLLGVSAP